MYKRFFSILFMFLFVSNLSLYAQETDDKYLVLINKYNPLDSNYSPEKTINISKHIRATKKEILMEEEAGLKYIEMVSEMVLSGITDLAAVSGYRNYSRQTTLFNNQIARHKTLAYEEAFNRAAMVVAPPGSSEHQSGLAIDVSSSQIGFALSQNFENTTAFKWLSENAHTYGFIIRYPKDKTHITGIIYEPWHLRYVGKYHADKIAEYGITLEEYMAIINAELALNNE